MASSSGGVLKDENMEVVWSMIENKREEVEKVEKGLAKNDPLNMKMKGEIRKKI